MIAAGPPRSARVLTTGAGASTRSPENPAPAPTARSFMCTSLFGLVDYPRVGATNRFFKCSFSPDRQSIAKAAERQSPLRGGAGIAPASSRHAGKDAALLVFNCINKRYLVL